MEHTQPANPGFPLVQIALSMDSVDDVNRLGPVLRSLLSPAIFGYANGGIVAPGDLAVVGENGTDPQAQASDQGAGTEVYPAVVSAQTTDETDQDGDEDAATGDKPKRKRRTKEQIAADNAAAEAARQAETAPVPEPEVAGDPVTNEPQPEPAAPALKYKVPQESKEMLELLTEYVKAYTGDNLREILNKKMNVINFSALKPERYAELLTHLPADWLEKRNVA